MNHQVDNSHYNFNKYNTISRWDSYYYQIKEILNLNLKNVLEIGPGANILKSVLPIYGIKYYSCDIASDLNPDYLQDVRELKINKKFDVVCAFQVLEHLPFEFFEQSLCSMKDHSNKYVLISLPRCGAKFRFSFKLPNIQQFSFSFKFPRIKKFEFNGEHYWEIDAPETRKIDVEKIIKKHFTILKEYIIPENAYHQIYILKKK